MIVTGASNPSEHRYKNVEEVPNYCLSKLLIIIENELNRVHETSSAVLGDPDVPMPAPLESAVDALT